MKNSGFNRLLSRIAAVLAGLFAVVLLAQPQNVAAQTTEKTFTLAPAELLR
jgi:preprotein translocase subunit SecG